MDVLESTAESLTVLETVVSGISPADSDRQTPCREFDVASLTEHLYNSIITLGGVAGGQFPDRDTGDTVAQQVIPPAHLAIRAWQQRGTDGDVDFGPQPFPARLAAGILALEFLVHACDYAAAVGADVTVPDEVAESVLALARQVITPEGRKVAGFDAPIELPADAPALHRLLAFTGRHTV